MLRCEYQDTPQGWLTTFLGWGKGQAVAEHADSATPWQRLCSALRRVLRRFETERGDDHAQWTLTVRVRPATLDGGWVAECPELPGCFSQGETREEALSNLSDAITGVISLRLEQQLSAAADSSTEEELTVAVAS
jgi:predicted RNase H-like HicB family nuclease